MGTVFAVRRGIPAGTVLAVGIDVVIETGKKKVFASALDWRQVPGYRGGSFAAICCLRTPSSSSAVQKQRYAVPLASSRSQCSR